MIRRVGNLVFFFWVLILSHFSAIAQGDCTACYNDCSSPQTTPCFSSPGYNYPDQATCLDACAGVPVNTKAWMLIPAGISLMVLALIFNKKNLKDV